MDTKREEKVNQEQGTLALKMFQELNQRVAEIERMLNMVGKKNRRESA